MARTFTHAKRAKTSGLIRYIGVTTSHGRRHSELERIMKTEPIGFVQLTYNIADREVENSLLPLAKEKNISVIANRPYQGGRLMSRYERQPIPIWAKDIGCDNWPQFFYALLLVILR